MSIPRTEEDYMPPIHPGEMLREEFMVPLRLSTEKLAAVLCISSYLIDSVVAEQQGFTGELALRLSRYFGTSAEFWMNMQKTYELSLARDRVGALIHREVQPAPRDQEGYLLAEPEAVVQQPSHA